jgi:hypothetical protein
MGRYVKYLLNSWASQSPRYTSPVLWECFNTGISLSLSSFVLEGVFNDPTPTPAVDIKVIKVGVRLAGAHSITHNEDGTMSQGKTYIYSVFGDLSLKFLPQPVSFEISECGDLVNLSLELDGKWTHAFGVSLLTVCFRSLPSKVCY